MTTASNDFLAAARLAIQLGQREQAEALLQQAIRLDPADHRGWLWLSGVSRSRRASLAYARRAAALQPNDPAVGQALDWAEKRLKERAAPAPRPTAGAASGSADSGPRSDAGPRPRRRWPRWVNASLLLLALLGGLATAAWYYGGEGRQTLAEAPLSIELPASKQANVAGNLGSGATAAPPTETAAPPTPTETPAPLGPKGVNGDEEARPMWTATPSPTFTPTATPPPMATPSPVPTAVSSGSSVNLPPGLQPGERWIDVNLSTQTLKAYEGTQLVLTSLVSSGTWQFPTVTGLFRVYLRYEAQTMNGYLLGYDYFLPNVPYVMYFYRDYALHGTYWHNNFGTPMSHGCVNLPTPNAEWLFNWSSLGTLVSVHH